MNGDTSILKDVEELSEDFDWENVVVNLKIN